MRLAPRFRLRLPPAGLVLLAVSAALGALLGSLLGPRAWMFFAGAALGAGLVLVLRLRARRRTSGRRSRPTRAPKEYDLRRDRSTDGQRWPM
jgi:hypothetical protein